jgi:hypothetical protein
VLQKYEEKVQSSPLLLVIIKGSRACNYLEPNHFFGMMSFLDPTFYVYLLAGNDNGTTISSVGIAYGANALLLSSGWIFGRR